MWNPLCCINPRWGVLLCAALYLYEDSHIWFGPPRSTTPTFEVYVGTKMYWAGVVLFYFLSSILLLIGSIFNFFICVELGFVTLCGRIAVDIIKWVGVPLACWRWDREGTYYPFCRVQIDADVYAVIELIGLPFVFYLVYAYYVDLGGPKFCGGLTYCPLEKVECGPFAQRTQPDRDDSDDTQQEGDVPLSLCPSMEADSGQLGSSMKQLVQKKQPALESASNSISNNNNSQCKNEQLTSPSEAVSQVDSVI